MAKTRISNIKVLVPCSHITAAIVAA